MSEVAWPKLVTKRSGNEGIYLELETTTDGEMENAVEVLENESKGSRRRQGNPD